MLTRTKTPVGHSNLMSACWTFVPRYRTRVWTPRQCPHNSNFGLVEAKFRASLCAMRRCGPRNCSVFVFPIVQEMLIYPLAAPHVPLTAYYFYLYFLNHLNLTPEVSRHRPHQFHYWKTNIFQVCFKLALLVNWLTLSFFEIKSKQNIYL